MARALGLARERNWATTDFAFDVLSLQALFLVTIASKIQVNDRCPEHSLFLVCGSTMASYYRVRNH